MSDEKLQAVLANVAPVTLPMQAYGPNPVEWVREPPPVWAWISWPHQPAERVEAFALGWNDRVVIVQWDTPTGSVNTVVWRNAVTRRPQQPSASSGR